MHNEQEIGQNATTEEKIKEAARRVFTSKGYAGTRTRDIAEESGFNLALINYYFRSKERLFDLIMVEYLQTFIHSIIGMLDDRETSLREKVRLLVGHYIDMLIKNPDLPMFILREVQTDPAKLVEKLRFDESHNALYIVTQWKEIAARRKGPAIDPVHMLMNAISLTVFPFIAGPMLRNRTGLSIEEFNELMEQRKKMIPVWLHAIMMSMDDIT